MIVIIGRALLKIGSGIEGRSCEICLVTRHCDPPNSTSSSEAVAKLFGPATQFINRKIIAAPYDGVPLFGLPPLGAVGEIAEVRRRLGLPSLPF